MFKLNSIFLRSLFLILFCLLAAVGFITWLICSAPSKEQALATFIALCLFYLIVAVLNAYLNMWRSNNHE